MPQRSDSVASAHAPVARLSTMVRNGKNCHGLAIDLVENLVRKVTKEVSPDAVFIGGPDRRIGLKQVDRFKRLGAVSICCHGFLPLPRAERQRRSGSQSAQPRPGFGPRNGLDRPGAKCRLAYLELLSPGVGYRRVFAALKAVEQGHDQGRTLIGRQAQGLVEKVINARIHAESLAFAPGLTSP